MLRNIVVALALLGLVPTAASCTGGATEESTGEYVDSAVISAKVRTQIARDDRLSIFDIDVTTYKNVVQLSGFVSNPEMKERAGEIASDVEGVREVRNNIQIKPGA